MIVNSYSSYGCFIVYFTFVGLLLLYALLLTVACLFAAFFSINTQYIVEVEEKFKI